MTDYRDARFTLHGQALRGEVSSKNAGKMVRTSRTRAPSTSSLIVGGVVAWDHRPGRGPQSKFKCPPANCPGATSNDWRNTFRPSRSTSASSRKAGSMGTWGTSTLPCAHPLRNDEEGGPVRQVRGPVYSMNLIPLQPQALTIPPAECAVHVLPSCQVVRIQPWQMVSAARKRQVAKLIIGGSHGRTVFKRLSNEEIGYTI
ncbi:hypothetical protein FIBSPDRAFT_883677 [Athelia psychrophila]|uniref:Uncharacterized protein n=1 Tax=Athelia psychrophila TaxID=1759441 RepID=A0A166TTN0_9AGAM|nr:hypothetical protein FIBSPDRAFT_883677 [Fibularhizoctonia sp. CBS 109695]